LKAGERLPAKRAAGDKSEEEDDNRDERQRQGHRSSVIFVAVAVVAAVERERTGAEPLLWDVQSGRNLFAKSAGKRGMISMHEIT
jgi:hypothetical protein